MPSQPLLEGEIADFSNPIDPFAERVAELEDRVATLELQLNKVKRDAVVTLLHILSESMRHIASGKMDISDTPSIPTTSDGSKWDALKRKYAGTHIANAIEVLQTHGRLNTSQLAANMGVGRSNATNNIVPKLIRMGIVTRQGNDLLLRDTP